GSVKDCMHRIDPVLVNERTRTGDHLAKHDTERKNIASPIDALPQQLLRRHVINRTEKRARFRIDSKESFLFAVGGERSFTLRDEFCQAEIEDLCVTVATDHEVLRLQVTVNDSEF